MGIDEDIHPHIFNMFYRGSEYAIVIGLGLYIVKSEIEKLGGTISLSGLSAIGSVFDIKIPNLPLSNQF